MANGFEAVQRYPSRCQGDNGALLFSVLLIKSLRNKGLHARVIGIRRGRTAYTPPPTSPRANTKGRILHDSAIVVCGKPLPTEVPGVDTDWDISSRSRPTTAKSSLAYSS